jgi:hypothetical protein
MLTLTSLTFLIIIRRRVVLKIYVIIIFVKLRADNIIKNIDG